MMLSRFREALEDSQQAVRLDDCFMKVSEQSFYFQFFMPRIVLRPQLNLQNKEKFVSIYTALRRKCATPVLQGHLREGKCHLSLGNAMAASRCFQKVLELEPSNREAQQEVRIT